MAMVFLVVISGIGIYFATRTSSSLTIPIPIPPPPSPPPPPPPPPPPITCPAGNSLCGGKCYDPTTLVCMQNGGTCPKSHYCMVNSKETCCDAYCKNNMCTNCPNQMCGSTCCSDPSQTCFTDSNNTQVCCTTDKWDHNNMQCCPNVVCNGKCCQAGEICIENQCRTPCGNTGCDPLTQFCFGSPPKCFDRSTCNWTPVVATPNFIDGTPTCQAQDGTVWLTTAGGKNSKWGSTTCTLDKGVNCISTSSGYPTCNSVVSCGNLLGQQNQPVTIQKDGDTNFCTAQLNCDKILLQPGDPKLESICNDLDGRCALNPSGDSFTGQVCPPGTKWSNNKCQ